MKTLQLGVLSALAVLVIACVPEDSQSSEAPSDDPAAATAHVGHEESSPIATGGPDTPAEGGPKVSTPGQSSAAVHEAQIEDVDAVELNPEAPAAPDFSVKFRDEISPYEVIGMFAMPGETVEIETVLTQPDATFTIKPTGGTIEEVDENRWKWTAPEEPGLYPIKVTSTATRSEVTINAFTMVPESETVDGKLGDFRVGTYPPDDEVAKKAQYDNPEGFIEVTRDTVDAKLSPHFKLGQFVSKQPSDIPKYVYLSERLVLKLEALLREYNDAGMDVKTFHIMSGYRTPFYNKAIGNVEFSRHVFGDAADIFVDNDGDGRMDDLNGDGKTDYEDAKYMADRIEDLFDEPWYQPFIGGLGIYGPAPHRGPFIHVDTRGTKARWTAP